MMKTTIRQTLFNLAEVDYQRFIASLLPHTDNIIGVRQPLLRKLAREIACGDWRSFMARAGNRYFEEIMLQGMVLGYVKTDLAELFEYTADFIPKINNWSVCDTFCAGLKITKRYKKQVWDFLQPYLRSGQEFEIRFAVVMYLAYYIEDEYITQVLTHLDNIKHDGYYVKMAVAWALSVCFIKQPEPTMAYLKNNTLDKFTYNKALQKIVESYRVDKETKQLIRSIKHK
jgi:3-methyladenine DNA glycosylase AlkD